MTWQAALVLAVPISALALGVIYQGQVMLALWKITRRGFIEVLKDPLPLYDCRRCGEPFGEHLDNSLGLRCKNSSAYFYPKVPR